MTLFCVANIFYLSANTIHFKKHNNVNIAVKRSGEVNIFSGNPPNLLDTFFLPEIPHMAGLEVFYRQFHFPLSNLPRAFFVYIYYYLRETEPAEDNPKYIE